jgi:hypothetical protein
MAILDLNKFSRAPSKVDGRAAMFTRVPRLCHTETNA